jgi:predicted transcriptional regulator
MHYFKDRILYLVEKHSNGDKKAFSKAIEVPYTTLMDYCTGKKTDPKMSFLIKIIETYQDVNTYWLLTGKENNTHYRNAIAAESAAAYESAALEEIKTLKTKVETLENVFRLMSLNVPKT